MPQAPTVSWCLRCAETASALTEMVLLLWQIVTLLVAVPSVGAADAANAVWAIHSRTVHATARLRTLFRAISRSS